MAGGLHVLDMIKTLRNNKNLRANNYFKKDHHSHHIHHTESWENNMPVASSEERETIKLRMIENRKKEVNKKLWALGISVLIAALITILLLLLF